MQPYQQHTLRVVGWLPLCPAAVISHIHTPHTHTSLPYSPSPRRELIHAPSLTQQLVWLVCERGANLTITIISSSMPGNMLSSFVMMALMGIAAGTPHPECEPCAAVAKAELDALDVNGKVCPPWPRKHHSLSKLQLCVFSKVLRVQGERGGIGENIRWPRCSDLDGRQQRLVCWETLGDVEALLAQTASAGSLSPSHACTKNCLLSLVISIPASGLCRHCCCGAAGADGRR